MWKLLRTRKLWAELSQTNVHIDPFALSLPSARRVASKVEWQFLFYSPVLFPIYKLLIPAHLSASLYENCRKQLTCQSLLLLQLLQILPHRDRYCSQRAVHLWLLCMSCESTDTRLFVVSMRNGTALLLCYCRTKGTWRKSQGNFPFFLLSTHYGLGPQIAAKTMYHLWNNRVKLTCDAWREVWSRGEGGGSTPHDENTTTNVEPDTSWEATNFLSPTAEQNTLTDRGDLLTCRDFFPNAKGKEKHHQTSHTCVWAFVRMLMFLWEV